MRIVNTASRPRRASKRRGAGIIERLPRSLRDCDTNDLERTLFWMQRGLLPTLSKIERIQAELQRRECAAHEVCLTMPQDFFDPTPEEQNVVLIYATTLRKAERLIKTCEHCNEGDAEIPFDALLDRVTGSDPTVTDYILEAPAKCPACHRDILEKTLVERVRRGAAPVPGPQ